MQRILIIAALFLFGLCVPASAQFNGCQAGFCSPKAVSSGSLACSYTPVTTGTQGTAYTGATPSASGGTPGYTYSETGTLPGGLTISSSTGVISGTPTANGSFPSIQVVVTDSLSNTANCGSSFTLVISPAPSYQGPGDVVAGLTSFGSVYRAASSSTATGTSMADLVASGGTGTVLCTLKTAASGFADLTAYCPGALTPAATCAAASGGSCVVKQVYDQVGTNHWSQTTVSAMPAITFSAVNGLPALTCSGSVVLNTTATFSPTAYSETTVYERTSNIVVSGAFGFSSNGWIGAGSVANSALIAQGTSVNVRAGSVADSAWHGLSATFSTVASSDALSVDGVDTTGIAAGTTSPSSVPLRFCRAGANELNGHVAEGGYWGSYSFTSTDRTNLYNNFHGTSGYNGAF